MGVWIEIALGENPEEKIKVTPYVGVWIEIQWGTDGHHGKQWNRQNISIHTPT